MPPPRQLPIRKITFTKQLGSLALTLAIFVLSILVVNWGLQYKMSLYQQHGSAKAQTSVAKLWTGSKDKAQVNQASVALGKLNPIAFATAFFTVFSALFFAFCIDVAVTTFLRWRLVGYTCKLYLTNLQHSYFFRPPPAAA